MSTRITDLRRLWQAGATAAVALAVAGAAAADVEVLGVEGPLATNVLAYLDLDEEPCDAPRLRVEQLYGRAPPRIRDALQAFGYYEPTVTPELTFADACWHARFTIAAGEPVRIRTLQLGLTGAAETDSPFVTALAQTTLAAGAPLDHGAYEQLEAPVVGPRPRARLRRRAFRHESHRRLSRRARRRHRIAIRLRASRTPSAAPSSRKTW